MGFKPLLISVDMRYRKDFTSTIQRSLANTGLDAVILDPKAITETDGTGFATALSRFLPGTESTRGLVSEHFTPCTACYNCKLLTIGKYLGDKKHGTIAFGHHATDAVVSYLKSFVMYYDRWYLKHELFSLTNFKDAAKQIYQDIVSAPSLERADVVALMRSLSAENKISTDEPPLEISKVGAANIKIIRPLFCVDELRIKAFARSTGIAFNAMDCGHQVDTAQGSPRDVVHSLFFGTQAFVERMAELHALVLLDIKSKLTADGTLTFNARRNRDAILGAGYKPNNGFAMKL